MWTLRPAHFIRCAPTQTNPATRTVLRVQHHQVRHAQAAAACLVGAADSNTFNASQYRPHQHSPNTSPSAIAYPYQEPRNTPSSRIVASKIRLAIRNKDFAAAFQLHRNFQASLPSSVYQSRLVTTSLIHSLLRGGRTFKAAQIAEIALLGAPSGPSIFASHHRSGSSTPLKLSARTSEAIILALCPLASSTTPAPPPWRLFLTPDQIGQNAAKELEWRRKLLNEELDTELKVAAEKEGGLLPNLTSHGYFTRRMIDKSDGIGCRQERALDKSTRRAITFLRVVRKAKQRRTSLMFQALIDACLLQGEIIVGTLLFVLLVKEWSAAKAVVGRNVMRAESEGFLRAAPLPSPLMTVAQVDQGMLPSPSSGQRWAAPVTLAFASPDEPAMTPDYHPELSPPVEKPKHRPRPSDSPLSYSGIEGILQNLLGIIRFPIGQSRIDFTSPSFTQQLHVLDRYPQVPRAKADIASSCLVQLINDGHLDPVSPQLLDSLVDSSNIGTNSPGEQAAVDEKVPDLSEARAQAVEAAFAGLMSYPSNLTKADFHSLLRSAAFGLGSTEKMANVLDTMEKMGFTTDDDETFALILRGCVHSRDWEAAESVVGRIRMVYEEREKVERPFEQPAQRTQNPLTFDPRVPLLIYGQACFDSPGYTPETKPYQFVRSWLAQKDRISQILPSGPPVLVNALLEWLTITGRARLIAENIDYLVAVAYVDSASGFKQNVGLAASFGAEFYERILRALQVDGGFVNLGFAERIWAVAKRAEVHSWNMALEDRVEEVQAEDSSRRPWTLGAASVPLMEFYALGRRMRAVERPATWPATRSLNSAKFATTSWWAQPSKLMFGKSEKPTTTRQTSALRAVELHHLTMSSVDVTASQLQASWQEVKRSQRKASDGRAAPLVQHESGFQSLLGPPGHSYWTALLSVVSDLRNLVPVFDHPEAPAKWPIVQEEGAYLVKIRPFEVTDSMNQAFLRVVKDMKAFGWVVGEVVPMSREEEAKRRR